MKGGLQHASEVKGQQGSVGTAIQDGIKSEVTKSLVVAGIQKVVTMLIPGGGFINAIIGAFQTVQTVIQQGAQIAQVVTSALGSIGAIAAGNIGSAVGLIDRTLGGAIPVALAWLGKVVGIGNIGGKVKSVILKVRARLDSVVDKLVGKVKGLIDKFFGKGKNKTEADERTTSQKVRDVDSAAREADALLTLPQATPRSVRTRLPGIKTKYKLNTLDLIQEKDQEYHIFAKINPEVTGPSRKLSHQEKSDIKSGTASVRQYDTPYSQLTPKQKSDLRIKLKNRTITKDEFAALDWDRRFSNRRKRGVDRFWASERTAIRNGTPSRNWTQDQQKDILAGKTPQLNGKAIEGHHRYNAIDHPNIADLSENIHPASWDEHFNKWHGGNFKNDTFGTPNNPSYPDNF